MKKILLSFFGREIIFNLNWFEYLIFRNVFKKKKYEVKLKNRIIKGLKLDLAVYDEAGNINWKESNKIYGKN